ncbi:MAG: hypothetical protein O7E52_23960 [Candidatus Poribacteria bacterium]|nr:hypothetical protein [Candidatus Poribacteria bacterium]
MRYRIRYDDGTWLGKSRPVITQKAALTFNNINIAREVATNTEKMEPTSEKLGTWKIIVDCLERGDGSCSEQV